jgi:hypothetical protein
MPGGNKMARKTNAQLIEENMTLTSCNIWLENVNAGLVVMMRNAQGYMEEISKQLDGIVPAVNDARDVYTKLVKDIEEANNGRKGTQD